MIVDRARPVALLLLVCTLHRAAPGQTAPAWSTATDILREHEWGDATNNLLDIVAAMPDAQYAFRPNPKMRSFGEVVGHITDVQFGFCDAARNDTTRKRDRWEKKPGRAEVLRGLRESIAVCDSAFDQLSDAPLTMRSGQTILADLFITMPLTACCVLAAGRVATTAPVATRRVCPPEQRVTTSAATGQQLALLSQSLLTATVRGDPAPWRAILRDDGLFDSENGNTVSKADRIRDAVPLPPGYEATLTLTHPRVRRTPRTSVISYDAIDTERVFGQPLVTRYRYMDVYQAEAGCWFLTASQTAVIPSEPTATGPLAPDVAAYDGVYRLTEAHELTVTHAGRQVYLQVGAGPRAELRALGGDHFAIPEAPRSSRIFVRDSSGRVVGLSFRRDNNDLIWQRVR